jgi:tetratricopeptide (TPR) repeat protein
MKIKHLLSVFAGCALIALATLTATAQTGRLEGDVVKADTKEPIVGAEIQIERTDIKGAYPVKTDKKGHFLHAGVPYVGTYTIIASAPGCQPDFIQNIRGSHTEMIKFELRPGDGKKLTLADVKGLQASAPKGGQPMNSAEQKKAMEEYEKKRAEVESKNKKMMEEHESMKKRFEAGQQFMAAKDWNGAANEFGEAAKLDAEQQAVWQGLAMALYNRGVTSFNEYAKDMANNGPKKEAAKQDFNDSINAISKAMALVEPLLNDPQKGALAKKSNGAYLKTKADAESLLATKLGAADLADQANKDYLAAAGVSDLPEDKKSFPIKGAVTLREAGKNDEAVAALKVILDTDPESVDALYNLGLVYANTEKTWQDAANALQKFVDKAPATDPRVAEAKSVIGYLIQGNNIVLPKSEADKKKSTPAKKKP